MLIIHYKLWENAIINYRTYKKANNISKLLKKQLKFITILKQYKKWKNILGILNVENKLNFDEK